MDLSERSLRHAGPNRRRRASPWSANKAGSEARIVLDEIDVRILAVLQRQGRISKTALAEQIHLSPSACFERMRRLEKHKVILSYHANVNLRVLMQSQTFFTEVTLKSHHAHDFRRFESFIVKLPEVVECHALGGGIDYLVKIVAKDVDDYQTLVDHLLESEIGIDRYFTYIVTKPVKSLPQFQVETLL